jgi:LysM repeat protein
MSQNGNRVIDTYLAQVLSQYNPQSQTITLGANINSQVNDLLAYAQTASVPLTSATVLSTSVQVTIRGNGPVPKLGGSQSIELVGTDVNGALGLVLTAIPAAVVDLKSTFPGLAGSTKAESGIIVPVQSLFYDFNYLAPQWLITDITPPENIVYPAVGLNFTADVDVRPHFPFVAALTSASVVTFKGPASFPANNPTQLYLDAEFPGFTMPIGTMQMRDFHLLIRTVYYTDEPEYNFTGNIFTGVLDIGQGVSARIGVDTQSVSRQNQSSAVWSFFSDFGPGGLPLSAGLQALAGFVGGDAANFQMPESVRDLGTFGLSRVVVGVNPSRPLDIEFVFLEVGSPKTWEPPIPYIAVEDLHVQWQILKPFDSASRQQSGGVGGTLKFGKQNPVHLDVTALIPEYIINANLRQGDEISVVDALSTFFPDAGGLQQDLVIDDLNIVANFDSKVYEFAASVKPVPPFSLNLVITTLVLNRVSVSFNYTQNQLYGTVLAELELLSANWEVSAAYMKPGADSGSNSLTQGNWTFLVRLKEGEQINLSQLLAKFLDFNPAYIPQVSLEGLYFQYNLADKTYTFKGTVKGYWNLDIIPGSPALQITASANVSSFIQNQVTRYRGDIQGTLAINAFQIGVGYAYDPTSTTLSFAIQYKRLALYATLTRTTKKVDGKDVTVSILRVTLGDLSLGEIVAYLVNLANPNADFRLDPPWDILNSLNLKNLALVFDLTNNTVGIDYTLNLQLVFLYIESVGLTYLKKKNGKSTVEMRIRGRFLDQSFGEGDELKWDMLDDPAPAVPGKGNKLFDLQYVGMGQHVALRNSVALNSVSEVIDALKQNMLPVKDANRNPLTQPAQQTLVFNKDSHWLFGVQFVALGGIAVSIVFNDPYLYGLLVELSGDVAGPLKGLSFQLLYKRITDNLGVFKIVLRVPDAFRQIDFGQVSLTLPIIKLDIYTNGNFKVDLGFPTDERFLESFAVQVFPFIGKGGIYFGYLVGAASTTVPSITNGEFSPVIEMGLALVVGVGKEISKGPLSAGLSLTLQVIMEGTLAWFNPYDQSKSKAMYYRVQGTAALVGRLYGAVDFKVIKVSIAVTARASVTLIVECYQAIEVNMTVEVSVQASIKILFIRINFSFGLRLDLSFKIGGASPTPWIVDPTKPLPHGNRLTRNFMLPGGSHQGLVARATGNGSRLYWCTPPNRIPIAALPKRRITAIRPRLRAEDVALLDHPVSPLFYAALSQPKPTFNWTPIAVFSAVQSLPILVLPALTVVSNAYLLPEDQTPEPTSRQVPLTFVVENGIHPQARTLSEINRCTAEHAHATSNVRQLPFNLMVEGMLAWCITSFIQGGESDPLDGGIERSELEALNTALDNSYTEGDAFTSLQLQGFLNLNYLFRLGTYTGDMSQVNATSATFLPALPPLSMQLPGRDIIDFRNYRPIGTKYEDTVAGYFAAMAINYGTNTSPDPFGTYTVTPSNESPQSVAQMVQRDYFMVIARGAAQNALKLMDAFPNPVTSADSLANIASKYVRTGMDHVIQAGETTETLEKTYYMTLQQLQDLNPGVDFTKPLPPGAVIKVLVGPTVESIVQGNKDATELLKKDSVVPIRGAKYQVRTGDSVSVLVAQRGVSLLSLLQLNQDSTQLLNLGQLFQLPAFTYTSVQGDTLNFVAAYLLVRNGELAALPDQAWFQLEKFAWYQQTVSVLNYDNNGKLVDFEKPIPPGTAILVPPSDKESDPTKALTYLSRAGDTLARIAGYFLLMQNPTAGYTAFRNSLQVSGGMQPADPLPVGTSVGVPAWQHRTQTIDSFARFTTALQITLQNVLTSTSLADPALLQPLAVLLLPDIQYQLPDEQQTFTTLASRFNMDLDSLAQSLADATSYFNDAVLIVPNLATISVRSLLEAVAVGSVNEIASTTSRFMLNGLLLPLPPANPVDPPDTTNLYGMYEIVGQQVSVNQFTLPLTITLSTTEAPAPPEQPGGIEFFQMHLVVSGETYESLLQQYPNLLQYNSGLIPADIQPGVLLFVTQETQLDITIDQTFIDQNEASPDLALSWRDPLKPIRPVPLFDTNPARYTLPSSIHWQASQQPPYAGETPAPTGQPGEPSIWPLSQNLLEEIRSGRGGSHPYQFMIGGIDEDGAMLTKELTRYDWATLFSVRVRRVPKEPAGLETPLPPVEQGPQAVNSEFMPHTYQLFAGGNEVQTVLLELWSFIKNNPGESSAFIKLLYSPGSQSDNPEGLQSLNEVQDSTYILKSNLSTLSTSGQNISAALRAMRGIRDEAPPLYVATIKEAERFLQLIWEAGVVGTGGYFLNYIAGEKGLPEGLFGQDGSAELSVLVILPSQSKAMNPVRSFYAFNNCAVAGDNITVGNANVFVQRSDGSELVRSATVPPGVVGFAGARNNPGENQPSTGIPEWRTQILYSLLGYRAQPGGAFKQSNQALPIGPSVPPGSEEKFRKALVAQEYAWFYQQNVPAYELVSTYALSHSPHLPDPRRNPYAGVGVASNISVAFDVQDVYGNRLVPTNPIPAVPLQVAYTDPLIPVSAWPGTSANYDFTVVENPVTKQYDEAGIRLSLGFQTGNYIPGAGINFAQSQYNVSAHELKCSQIYYQIEQPNLRLAVSTSLMRNPNTPAGDFTVDLVAPRQYAQSVCIFLKAAARIQQATKTASSGPPQTTFAGIAAELPVSVEEIGAANAEVRLDLLFAQVWIPRYTVFPQQGTFRQVAAAGNISVATLAEQNADVELNAGVVLITPQRTFHASGQTNSLLELAQLNLTTVENIAQTNAVDETILTAAKLVVVEGVTLEVQPEDSFEKLVLRFAVNGVTTNAQSVAVANQEVPGLIVTGSSLNVNAYVIQPGDTFFAIIARFPSWNISSVAMLSQDIPNAIVPGLSILLGTGSQVIPNPGDTFSYYGLIYSLTVAQLALANEQQPLRDGALILLPGMATVNPSEAEPIYVSYSIPDNSTWNAMVANLGWNNSQQQTTLMTANQYTPDLLNPSITITIGGEHTTTTADSTFHSVLQALNQGGANYNYSDLIAAIATISGLLKRWGAVATPVPAAPAGKDLAQVSQQFNLTPPALAVANAAIINLIQSGQNVTIQGKTIQTRSGDTFATIAWNFQSTYKSSVSVEAIAMAVAGNPNFLVADAALLLPPKAVDFSVMLYTSIPNPLPYTQTVFGLVTTLTLSRPEDEIHDDFKNQADVKSFTSDIPPDLQIDENGEYLLNKFALNFEKIFKGLKMAVGNDRPAGARQIPPLFCVNFASTGIEKVDITPGNPIAFAIRPISTQLLSAVDLPIGPINEDGTLGPSVLQTYDSVDLDVWAQALIGLVDLFLTPEMAIPAYTLNAAALPAVLAEKSNLAETISKGLSAVLQGADTSGLQVAQERLKQALLVGLGSGFATNAALQYPSAITSHADTIASLSGKGIALLKSKDPGETDAVFTLTLSQTSTLESIESFFGTSLASIIGQISTLTPLLVEGGIFQFPGQSPFRVPSAQTTLQDVANHFGLLNATPVAQYNRTVPGYFQPGITISITMPIPDFDLSTAKVSLVNGGNYVTFLLTIPKEQRRKTLLINLDYQLNEIEYDITPVPDTGGFKSSQWLSFVIPMTAEHHPEAIARTLLGQADIPLALRGYPNMPAMREQGFEPSIKVLPPTFPQNMVAARAWNYSFSFDQNSSAQDSTFVSILLNQDLDQQRASKFDPTLRVLFQELAQFNAVYPILKEYLLALLDPAAIVSRETQLKNAIATFQSLVHRVATAWRAFWMPTQQLQAASLGLDPVRLDFEVVRIADFLVVPPTLRALVLKAQNQDGYPFDQYPDISILDPETLSYVDLTKTPTSSNLEVVYAFPITVRAFESASYRYKLNSLNSISMQNAWSQLQLKRNLELLPGRQISSAFIYETPHITFTNPIFPAIVREDVINTRTGPSETLEQAIQQIFETLLGSDADQTQLKVVVRYGYELAAPELGPSLGALAPGSIISEIPVLYYPQFLFSTAFETGMAAAIRRWFNYHHPAEQGGVYLFDITVYSQLAVALTQPVLELKRVAFPLA